MSKVLGTVWDLESHTAKKHEILRRYFQAWLPILAHGNNRLLYIDAFAGPGEYSKGEDGSPLVILKSARDHVLKFTAELLCVFIESDDDRYHHLVEVLDRIKPTLPNNIKFRHLPGKFNDQLTQIFPTMEEQRKHRAPILAFVDPFGFSQTPFSTIAKLMKYPKSEVLVNFMYEEINRFLGVPEFAQHFDAQFGTPEWREVAKISAPVERLFFIHDLYLKQLRTVAKYVRGFLMRNKNDTPDYFLFFATNSLEGLESMKQAMWKVDPTGEFHFSDFTDAKKQPSLFEAEPDYAWLQEIITNEFRHTQIESKLLGDWVVEKTPFLRTHIKKPVLIPMEKKGALSIVNPKPGRRPFTYPDGTIIKFH
jgi:three-Cys-motif partner protein